MQGESCFLSESNPITLLKLTRNKLVGCIDRPFCFMMSHSGEVKKFTKLEVKEHCTPDDCWIIVDGKVYDVTPYLPEHPGGSALLRQAGKDASLAIQLQQAHGFIRSFIKNKLPSLYIGDLAKS